MKLKSVGGAVCVARSTFSTTVDTKDKRFLFGIKKKYYKGFWRDTGET